MNAAHLCAKKIGDEPVGAPGGEAAIGPMSSAVPLAQLLLYHLFWTFQ